MAVYRCEFKIISRGKGHRACAAAAYRAAEKINDDRYGLQHDYSNKPGVVSSFILLPDNTPEWMQDREQLWNAVETAEKRKDAQLSREVLLSLPHELTDDQRSALVSSFVEQNFVAHGMIADVSIHKPESKGDHRNHHAHVMLTMRELTGDGFGKKVRAWNHTTFLEHVRSEWAEHQNRLFERLGLDERVDHRSLADQGIDREPEPKLGKFANENLRNGTYENANQVISNYFEVLDRNQKRAELEYQKNVINLALERIERGGDTKKQQQADLLARHALEMAAYNAQQASEQAQLVARQDKEIKEFKALSKQKLDKAFENAKPSRIERLYEILTFQRKQADQRRAQDQQQRKTDEHHAIRDLQKMMREEQIKLHNKHRQALSMLREAHQFERDIVTGRVDVEAALSPPQKHYRERPKMAANILVPSLVPQMVPKPPALHVNIIKARTNQRLFDLEEQERTGQPVRRERKPKPFGQWDKSRMKIGGSASTPHAPKSKQSKPKKKEHWQDRSITSDANKVFEKGRVTQRQESPVKDKIAKPKAKIGHALTDRTVKESANKAFEKPKTQTEKSKQPELKKIKTTPQKAKSVLTKRKRQSSELTDGQRRAKAIRQQKARKKREREAKQRGQDLGRKR